MDAFSGDSVPVHLITHEAFSTYFRHLKPDGILAVNISNRYLGLEPVMAQAAAHLGKVALEFSYEGADEDFLCFGCTWALIMDTAASLRPEFASGEVLHADGRFREWTDDYSNLLGILK